MVRNPRILLAAVGTLLVSGVAVGMLATVIPQDSRVALRAQQPAAGVQSGAGGQLTTAHHLSAAFNQAARVLRPAVVSIRSVTRVPAPQGRMRQDIPEEFRRFFDEDLFDRFGPQQVPRGGFEQRGLGSGVIISRDGYIVTNNHVIRGASEIDVTLFDGRTLSAEIVGADSKTDVAVLKVNGGNLTPARLGDSDALQVGDWVLAIGTPFELEQTVTAGIVSAKSRSSVGLTDYEDFIQTDAAINPGNSGGPLVNLNGEVVGINTAIASRTGGYMGIGFAIPSNMVKLVKDALVTDGKVERGRLGALIQDLDDDLARSFGYDSTRGVLIGDVVPGSPAQRAGLRSGDIVTHLDERPMANANQLRNSVASTKPGTTVKLTIVRNGKTQTVEAVVGRLDEDEVTVDNGPQTPDPLGLTVDTLSADVARQLGYDVDKRAVVITRVAPGSIADRAGLQAGDLILSVGDKLVRTSGEFQEQLDREDLQQGVRLRVERGGATRFLILKSRENG